MLDAVIAYSAINLVSTAALPSVNALASKAKRKQSLDQLVFARSSAIRGL
jgi:hypothetical protein